MTVTVREKGKTLERERRHGDDLGHVAGAEDRRDEGDRRVRRPLRARSCTARCSPASRAEQMATALAMYPMMKDAMAKMSAEGGKIDGTADPDHGDDGRGEVGRADGAGSEGRAARTTQAAAGRRPRRPAGRSSRRRWPEEEEAGKASRRPRFMTTNDRGAEGRDRRRGGGRRGAGGVQGKQVGMAAEGKHVEHGTRSRSCAVLSVARSARRRRRRSRRRNRPRRAPRASTRRRSSSTPTSTRP